MVRQAGDGIGCGEEEVAGRCTAAIGWRGRSGNF
jgi:hypothetical protein